MILDSRYEKSALNKVINEQTQNLTVDKNKCLLSFITNFEGFLFYNRYLE